MPKRRLILPLGLMCLALAIASSSAFLYPHSREITVPIDRSVLDAPKTAHAPVSAGVDTSETAPLRSLALKPAPDPRVIEKTPLGLLPRKADNGDRPADIYARKVDLRQVQKTQPKLAIVILRAGISETTTAEAYLALPPDVSFAVSPYAHDAERQARDIRNRGHEVFLEVQSVTDTPAIEDRGPYALDPRLDTERNRERLTWMMSRFTGYAGIVADLTSSARKSDMTRTLIANEIIPRGLLFLSLLRPNSQTLTESDEINSLEKPILLQVPGQKPTEILAALDHAKAEFKQGGHYIIAIDPGPLAIGTLKEWIALHHPRAFDLVPLSALMQSTEHM